MKEYIVSVRDDERDFEEVFIAYIRSQKELIHCKDCKHWDGYYCHNENWGDGYGNYTPPIKAEGGFCDWADRKEKWKNTN